jgi:hypothetical protein
MPDIQAFASANGSNPGSHYRDQLSHLSLEEKVSLLSGVSFTSTAGIDRLSIPPLKVSIRVRHPTVTMHGQLTSCICRSVTRSTVFAVPNHTLKTPVQLVFQARLALPQHGTPVS